MLTAGPVNNNNNNNKKLSVQDPGWWTSSNQMHNAQSSTRSRALNLQPDGLLHRTIREVALRNSLK